MPKRIAGYVLAADLAERLRMRDYARQQRTGIWAKLPFRGLVGLSAAIFGTGEIGSEIARTLKRNGYNVIGVNRSGRTAPEFDVTVSWPAPDSIRDADLVVGCLPLTNETAGVLGELAFQQLRKSHLINVGRGATVDVDAALRALDDGRLSAITTDVLAVEPPSPMDPLWTDPRVTVTPHVSGPTLVADVLQDFQKVRAALAAGASPPFLVHVLRGY